MAAALEIGKADPVRVVAAFSEYMNRGGHHVTRALFEQNITAKLRDRQFAADIGPLLAPAYHWDMEEAARTVSAGLIGLLPGEPWKGEGRASV